MRAQMMLCAMLLAACEPPVTTITRPTPTATADDGGPANSDAGNDALGAPECVANMDCCPNPAYDCGMRCTSGVCEYLAAPTADSPPLEEGELEGVSDDDATPTDDAGRDDATDDGCVPEFCDGLDNDCDDTVDNGCPGAGEDEDENEGAAADEDDAADSDASEDTADDGTVEAADDTEDPIVPLDDLSVAASWKTADLLALPDGTPARVRTVLDGFTTTDLPAFLIGFVPNPLTSDSRDAYLLLETDPADPRWDLVLGPVAGMSGSPIIINGRNAGALSFGIGDDLGPYLFVATPIEKMLDVEAQELDTALTDGASPAGVPLTAVLAIPAGAGVWLEGAGWADDRYLEVSEDFVGAAAVGGDAPPLVSGSAIAVLVISGDVLNLGGIGTVTATDGDALWAFGHPMTGMGDTSFPFSAASIEAIAASAAWGFSYKVGAPTGPMLGTITNDRTAAIAGRHVLAAPTVAVFTHGTYAGATEHLQHETARLTDNPWFNADQALFAAVWPLTVQRDAPFGGAGSIAYEVQVYVAETDAYATHRDIISSGWWPEAETFFTLVDSTAQLIGNDRLPLTLSSVILTADVSDDRREFTIGDLTHADEIAPGDELVVAVELLPFGSTEPETRALVLAIPEDFPSGPAEIQVGSELSLGDGPRPWDTWLDPMCGDTDATETPEDLIAKFNGIPRQQVLVGKLKSQAMPTDDCPPCVIILDADGNPKKDCPACEPTEHDSCVPPVQPSSIRASSEENGMILGSRTVIIEITGSDAPPLLEGETEGVPECPPDGCSETPIETSTDSGGGGGGSGEEPPPSTEEPTEPTCPAGDEVCDGCDNDADGVVDDGCPPPSD